MTIAAAGMSLRQTRSNPTPRGRLLDKVASELVRGAYWNKDADTIAANYAPIIGAGEYYNSLTYKRFSARETFLLDAIRIAAGEIDPAAGPLVIVLQLKSTGNRKWCATIYRRPKGQKDAEIITKEVTDELHPLNAFLTARIRATDELYPSRMEARQKADTTVSGYAVAAAPTTGHVTQTLGTIEYKSGCASTSWIGHTTYFQTDAGNIYRWDWRQIDPTPGRLDMAEARIDHNLRYGVDMPCAGTREAVEFVRDHAGSILTTLVRTREQEVRALLAHLFIVDPSVAATHYLDLLQANHELDAGNMEPDDHCRFVDEHRQAVIDAISAAAPDGVALIEESEGYLVYTLTGADLLPVLHNGLI